MPGKTLHASNVLFGWRVFLWERSGLFWPVLNQHPRIIACQYKNLVFGFLARTSAPFFLCLIFNHARGSYRPKPQGLLRAICGRLLISFLAFLNVCCVPVKEYIANIPEWFSRNK